MASKKKKKSTRTAEDYLASARELSQLVPSLKKFKTRKTLKKSERATIRRREKQLKNIPFLIPVTKQQAKRLKRRKLFLPGIRAIQLRSIQGATDPTAPGSKIKIKKNGDIEVIENGRHWIYWSLDRATVRSRRGMRDAGQRAFAKQFPIERVSDLTEAAFKAYNVQGVHLWAHAGIVGEEFQSVGRFIAWVNQKWNQGRYVSSREFANGDIYSDPSDPGKWVNGIAILIENPEYTKRRKKLDAQANKKNKIV